MNAQPGQHETDGAGRHNSDGRHLQLEMAVESHAVQRPIAGCCMARITEGIFLHTQIGIPVQQHRLNQLSATVVMATAFICSYRSQNNTRRCYFPGGRRAFRTI